MKTFCFFLLGLSTSLFGCTDFLIQAKDKTYVNGRSMEFGKNVASGVLIIPKGIAQKSAIPDGKSWTTKYAAIGMNVFGMDFFIDGVNEKGLTIGGLWLPGTEYPDDSSSSKEKVSLTDFGNWILGSFATVEEVKAALKQVVVIAEKLPQLGQIPPLHFSLHDAMGKSLVVEFSKGEMKLYDNQVGVLTNAPEFPWHETNLRNYLNLSSVNAAPIKLDGSVLSPTGQGSGLLGIPGDWTPPSRFVRIAIFKNLAAQASNRKENVNLALHLLNTVDIPYGAIRDRKDKQFDYTQWVVVKELNEPALIWRTYGDLNTKKLSLKEALQLAKGKVKKVSDTAALK